jgi:hypothetical protein
MDASALSERILGWNPALFVRAILYHNPILTSAAMLDQKQPVRYRFVGGPFKVDRVAEEDHCVSKP